MVTVTAAMIIAAIGGIIGGGKRRFLVQGLQRPRSGGVAFFVRRSGSSKSELGEIVDDTVVRSVLFINLENPRVFMVARGENLRRLAGKENSRVGAMTINEAANDEHTDSAVPLYDFSK